MSLDDDSAKQLVERLIELANKLTEADQFLSCRRAGMDLDLKPRESLEYEFDKLLLFGNLLDRSRWKK